MPLVKSGKYNMATINSSSSNNNTFTPTTTTFNSSYTTPSTTTTATPKANHYKYIVNGRYRIMQVVGEGSQGKVYKVEDRQDNNKMYAHLSFYCPPVSFYIFLIIFME